MRFKRIYLEITNRCNLACDFCLPHQRPLKSLSVPDFRHLIEEIKPLTNYLYFHVKGEPLLHPHLAQLLDICQQEGLQVTITTNGTLLREQQEMLLSKPALRQVAISIHSFDQQSPQQQDTYLSDILAFATKASQQNHCYVSLRLWNQQNGQLDDQTQTLLTTITTYFQPLQEAATPLDLTRGTTLMPGVFLSFDDQFDWPTFALPWQGKGGTCYGLRTQLAILADGTVVPCCLDGQGQMALGNALATPLSQILATDQCQNIAEGFRQQKIIAPLCQHCTYRQRFGH